ncbi:MAG: polyphosphate kinase 1 [Candidatus Methylacidiphilales bacterium]|nr:polyphosphate kinase 1 [Candidatus Methylacidiphilales bacterium]
MEDVDYSNPDYYINRELSWLEFNKRVLEEACDPLQPLLERLKFACIFTSNLDEFFEIRVGGIKQQIENELSEVAPDGLTAQEIFDCVRKRVQELLKIQYDLWNNELAPALADAGVRIFNRHELSEEDAAWATQYFTEEVFPVLTPLAIDPSHPFPQLLNKSHNLIVLLRRPDSPGELMYAIVQMPRVLPRMVRLPRPEKEGERKLFHYIPLRSLVSRSVDLLFPGLEVENAYGFRITRNSDLYIDDEEAENLLRSIMEELRKRNRGNAVRLELEPGTPGEIVHLLTEHFGLTPQDVYTNDGPLTFMHLMPLTGIELPQLKDKPFVPARPRNLPPDADIFDIIRRQDVLLHHPYESFNPVVEFMTRAAVDPNVLAIKITLYRTSGDSPIVRALMNAAENGKQVTALVEVKARFDEVNNINWARKMEDSGVHVVYGIVGLKTHCKMLLVVRRDEGKLRQYAHLGTGNYHPSTARIYTDLGLLTSNREITNEMASLFNTLTGLAEYQGGEGLVLVAPFNLAERFHALIAREAQLAREGKKGRIFVKVNSLVDEELIQALYDASNAGVKIDLVVRGICCLRPGIPGVSENIRVISIVGRFLEHSRIYFFGNDGGESQLYLGSADWMPRNLFRRVEVVFPVLDAKIKTRITDEIIPAFLKDCVKARELQSDGLYIRLHPAEGQKPQQAQLTFREIARRQSTGSNNVPAEAGSQANNFKLTPMTAPAKARD